MKLTFTRHVEEKGIRLLKKLLNVEYKLLGNEENSGLFQNEVSNQIVCNDKEFSIENISRSLTNTKYQIRDSDSKRIIGEITINGWDANPFWQDTPSVPNAEVRIGETVYNFRNITSWQTLSLFSRNRHKNYDFKLYSIKGNKFVNYTITLEIPVFRGIDYFNLIPFSGDAEINTPDNLLPLIGLFLIQQSFESENKNYGE